MAQTRAPSIKALTSAFRDVTPAIAKLIRAIIKTKNYDELMALCETHCPKSAAQFRKFYNYPSKGQVRAYCLDELLDTCGVGYIFAGGASDPGDDMNASPVVVYCNSGDPFSVTLLKYRGRWQVGCWGDIEERYL